MIQNVERVHAEFEVGRSPVVIRWTPDMKQFGSSHVELQHSGAFSCIPGYPRRPVVGDTVVVVVGSCSDVERNRGRSVEDDPYSKTAGEAHRTCEAEAVTPVEVGTPPLGEKVVVIRGEVERAGSVIRRSCKSILGKEVQALAHLATIIEAEDMAAHRRGGFHSVDVEEIAVGP